MRGLVMEVKKDTLVVLTAQGKYIEIRNQGAHAIGDFVPCDAPETSPLQWLPRIHWMPRQVMAMAASLLLVCSAGLGAYGYSQPFGVVNVDINPSMALTYNWFEQVIDVEALNADGEKLLPALTDLKHKPVSEAVKEVVAAASEAGYLEPELANVVFISVSDKNSKTRTTEVLQAIDRNLPHTENDTETVLLTGTPKTYDRTRQTHETPAQDLIDSSLKSKPENTPQTISGKPLKKILKEQEEKREKKSHPDASDDQVRPEDSTPQNVQDHDQDETPSKKPGQMNWNNSHENDGDDQNFRPGHSEKDRPQDHEFKNNFEERPDWNNQKPGNKKDSKDNN